MLPSVHWKLISDGDLCKHFLNAAHAKGHKAIKVTWVRGHAKVNHIDEGITSWANKIGNDKAEQVADQGSSRMDRI